MVDGPGDDEAKTFRYDATQGTWDVKLDSVTDPPGNDTDLSTTRRPSSSQNSDGSKPSASRTIGSDHGPAGSRTVTTKVIVPWLPLAMLDP